MTLTPEQLDELEAKAKAFMEARDAHDASVVEPPDYRAENRTYTAMDTAYRDLCGHIVPQAPHLVAVYRAALALGTQASGLDASPKDIAAIRAALRGDP